MKEEIDDQVYFRIGYKMLLRRDPQRFAVLAIKKRIPWSLGANSVIIDFDLYAELVSLGKTIMPEIEEEEKL